jgi:hypothetical protein
MDNGIDNDVPPSDDKRKGLNDSSLTSNMSGTSDFLGVSLFNSESVSRPSIDNELQVRGLLIARESRSTLEQKYRFAALQQQKLGQRYRNSSNTSK